MKGSRLQLILLGLLLAWALASQLTYSGLELMMASESETHVQVPFERFDYSKIIGSVWPGYADSGLQAGDELVSINGIAIDGDEQLARLWHASKPGDMVTLGLNRTTLTLRLQPLVKKPSGFALTLILKVVLPITCLLVGFYIAFARSTDSLAWITMAMLASFSQFAGSGTSVLLWSPWRELFFVYQPILSDLWPLWMILFAFYFPLPFPFIQRRPWLGWVIAIPFCALVGPDIYGNFERVQHLNRIRWLARFTHVIHTPVTIWFTACVFAFFGLLVAKRRFLNGPDAKRRLRVMITGCTFALTPTLPVAFSQINLTPALPAWLEVVCLSMLLLFPITMAYVIVVQRAMDVRMVVRSGVQYAFASTGIRILQIAIVVVVVAETSRYAQEANHDLAEILIVGLGISLVVSVGKLSRQVRGWMDKRFFREAYNAERILTDLSSSVAGIRDIRVLLETVTKRISESLHVPRIAVFLERGGAFRPAYALGSLPPLETAEFKQQSGVVSYLRKQQTPSRIFFGDPQNWVHGTPAAEQETLHKLDTQVLLPLSLKSRLLGIISLGGKRSEEPYSRADLQLLGAVASQTGLALENAELTESVRREIAQRERLDRELEIAREVQQRLFPQTLPVVKGLDFAGYCRPAEGVGGDYYDFIHLPDGSLGIAVGDVSGKGIAAALMMASLQASLRGQTIKPCETLSEMIQHINRLVYEASAENRYATFFYAQYNPATLVMRYVNAGHNPPMVWRRSDGKHEFIRLEDGGTVVGLFPEFPFVEGQIQLAKGDVVVAFTDGISEAMNSFEEEYGEDRLTAVLPLMNAWSAADMITHILTKVDGFTAGAKQHDDMTLVVVRVQ
jgi:sigma-B regulation protein RsbU (phosphoserine phosphatase)